MIIANNKAGIFQEKAWIHFIEAMKWIRFQTNWIQCISDIMCAPETLTVKYIVLHAYENTMIGCHSLSYHPYICQIHFFKYSKVKYEWIWQKAKERLQTMRSPIISIFPQWQQSYGTIVSVASRASKSEPPLILVLCQEDIWKVKVRKDKIFFAGYNYILIS